MWKMLKCKKVYMYLSSNDVSCDCMDLTHLYYIVICTVVIKTFSHVTQMCTQVE